MEDVKPRLEDLTPEQRRNFEQFVAMRNAVAEAMHEFVGEHRSEILQRATEKLRAKGIAVPPEMP